MFSLQVFSEEQPQYVRHIRYTLAQVDSKNDTDELEVQEGKEVCMGVSKQTQTQGHGDYFHFPSGDQGQGCVASNHRSAQRVIYL